MSRRAADQKRRLPFTIIAQTGEPLGKVRTRQSCASFIKRDSIGVFCLADEAVGLHAFHHCRRALAWIKLLQRQIGKTNLRPQRLKTRVVVSE